MMMSRCTSRATARTVARATAAPLVATTVYRPGVSATKRPSCSICPLAPGPRSSSGRASSARWIGTPASAAPVASRPSGVKRTTSPVRTSWASAVSWIEAIGLGTTLKSARASKPSAWATSSQRPGAVPVRFPKASTSASPEVPRATISSAGPRSRPASSTSTACTRAVVPTWSSSGTSRSSTPDRGGKATVTGTRIDGRGRETVATRATTEYSPGSRASTMPSLPTATPFGPREKKTTSNPSTSEPSSSKTRAISWVLSPTSIVSSEGVTSTCKVGTTSSWGPSTKGRQSSSTSIVSLLPEGGAGL